MQNMLISNFYEYQRSNGINDYKHTNFAMFVLDNELCISLDVKDTDKFLEMNHIDLLNISDKNAIEIKKAIDFYLEKKNIKVEV